MDLDFISVCKLGTLLRGGEVSAAELTEHSLERLEGIGEELNAVALVLRDEATAAARRADEERAQGIDRGPLHGIPYGAKDLLDTAGIPTGWGAAPFSDRVPDTNAEVIDHLESGGAVLTSKLAMVELAGSFGYTQAHASVSGPGLNAWDKGAWSGGSSSGSGSAVAAGAVPFAVGSETWGSITTPSAFNGITGLRPTYGRVSRRGAMTVSWGMDKIGPMARSAIDCKVVFEGLLGAPCSGSTDVSGSRPRIAVLRDCAADVQPEVRTNFEASLEVLGTFCELGEIELPQLPIAEAAEMIIICEAAAFFEDFIDSGEQKRLAAPEDRYGLLHATAVPAVDYIKALRVRTAAARRFTQLAQGFDAIVAPTLPCVANPIEVGFDEYFAPFASPNLGAIGNLCGLPAITVPNGFGERGLPTGLEFMGRQDSDELLLALAERYQKRTEFHQARPPV